MRRLLRSPKRVQRYQMDSTEATKITLPASSTLHARRKPGDFLDCYTVTATMPVRDAALVITDFPHWARFLLLIRRFRYDT